MGSQIRVSPYIIWYVFGPHAGEIKQNCTVQTKWNLELFDKKTGSFKTIFDKALTLFWKTFLWLKQLFSAKQLISRLQSFSVPKITVVRIRLTRLKVKRREPHPRLQDHVGPISEKWRWPTSFCPSRQRCSFYVAWWTIFSILN